MQREYWFLILSGIFYGTITPGGQFLLERGLSMFEVSFYRSLLVFLILLPVVLLRRRYMMEWSKVTFYALYGFIGALLELMMFSGIALGVPVAIVVLLLYTQPIWTVFIGRIILGEKITFVKLASVILGLFGLVFLLGSREAGSGGSYAGILCSLASGVLLSFWVILGKRSAMLDQHYITTTFGWSGFAFVWLLILLPVARIIVTDETLVSFSLDLSAANFTYLIIFAFLGGAIPHLLFFRALEKITASVAGIVLLLEPVSATILAWIFFSQSVGFFILLGGVFILISNYIVIREARNETPVF